MKLQEMDENINCISNSFFNEYKEHVWSFLENKTFSHDFLQNLLDSFRQFSLKHTVRYTISHITVLRGIVLL